MSSVTIMSGAVSGKESFNKFRWDGGGEGEGGEGSYNQSLTLFLPPRNHPFRDQLLAFIIKEEYWGILSGNYLAHIKRPCQFFFNF